ncbi:MAG: helix-turn-helix domain-containing protein [Nocardioides sp.]
MTNNTQSQGQPALWDAPDDERGGRGSSESRQRGGVVPSGPRPTSPMEFSELWTTDEVANYLGVPKQTIYCWRTSGYGPQGFRVGKHLRWRAATVIAWTVEMERQQ